MRGVRQHVNPLGQHYQEPKASRIGIPSGVAVDVELGCADGQFAFGMAKSHPDHFVVGLEIREALVVRNNAWAHRQGLTNLRFGYVNLNVDLDRVFGPSEVDRFHLLFPDPWFKSRHRKRRVVEIGLATVIAEQLRDGGELHFASDVFEVALEAMEVLESPEVAALGLRNVSEPWSFSRQNPTEPVMSKREQTTRARGQRVWRMRYGYLAAGTSTSSTSSGR